jgi:DNA primase large subunit
MTEGLDFALRYPFSESAKRSLEGLVLNDGIIELAVERIKKALTGDRSQRMLLHEAEKKDDIASFAAARMILGHMRNSFLTNRFAVNEAKKVSDSLGREDEATVETVAAIFGIRTVADGKRMLIDLPTYVRFAVRDPHYRLINRRIYRGMVELNSNEKRRLIEEAVKKHNESIPIVKDPPALIIKAAERLVAEMPKSESRFTVKAGDHPPCVMRLLEEAKKHENLPHHARWYLATYLLAAGMGEEDIVRIYSDLPDFSERVTSYQVSHIKKKGYNVPSCSTVMTYGLCCAVCRIGHPMNWHTLGDERKKSIRGGGI